MKKAGLITILFCILLVMAGCKTVSEPKVRRTSVSVSALADVEVSAVYSSNGIGSYVLTVENTSKNPIFIDWGDSSVSYGENSSYPFPEGIRYPEAVGEPVPDTEIGVGETFRKTIYCELQIFYNVEKSCWEVRPIPQYQTTVNICITDGRKYANYKCKTDNNR